ncbi:MAG: DUF6282 family protein [Candidatus Dormibacter sp.]
MRNVLTGLLHGAVDLHYHSAPSPFPRRMDVAEAARHYNDAGFRAVVMKSHHHNTVMDVLAVQSTTLHDLEVAVYGGIALNGPIGGLNPRAVELSLKMGGRVVWFPTTAAQAHIDYHKTHHSPFPTASIALRPEIGIDVVDADGEVLPEVHDILALIADADAILAFGHLDPVQIEAVHVAAQQVGVKRMLVNHPEFVVGMQHDHAARLAASGVYIEHEIGMYIERATSAPRPISELLDWIAAVGVDRTTIGSDAGQATNPLPADAYGALITKLLDSGVSEADITRMISTNPAELLGLN